MSEQLGLGKLITTDQPRDSIHIAVAPVTAASTLTRGMRIGVEKCPTCQMQPRLADAPPCLTCSGTGILADDRTLPLVGLVDPFLDVGTVQKGQRFWVYLRPGSISSLVHTWTHPTFPEPHRG